MHTENTSGDIMFEDAANCAIKYANSARPTIAHPIIHFMLPAKNAQKTLVPMHATRPMMEPFQKASMLSRSMTWVGNSWSLNFLRDSSVKTDDFIKMINSLDKTDDFIKMINSLSKTDDSIKMINSLSKTTCNDSTKMINDKSV